MSTKEKSIIRDKRASHNFTIMGNCVALNDKLSWRAKGLYWYVMTLPDDWKIYKSELCNHATEGYDSMSTAFNELVEMGYVTQKKARGKDGKFNGWLYTFHESTQRKNIPSNPTIMRRTIVTETGKCRSRQKPELLSTNRILKEKKKEYKEKENTIPEEVEKEDNTTIPLSLDEVLSYFPKDWQDNESFHSILGDYYRMRKGSTYPLSETSTKPLANKLTKYEMKTATQTLTNSVSNGWRGVFPEKVGGMVPQSKKAKASNTPHAVIDKHFIRSGKEGTLTERIFRDAFIKNIYTPAREWLRGDTTPELATQLLDLVEDITVYQNKHIPSDSTHLVSGPSLLVEDYIIWLGKASWLDNRSTHVFDIGHKVFSMFRRDEAKRAGGMERDALSFQSYLPG